MATHAEKVFVQLLVVPESLRQIIDAEYPEDLLPTDELAAIHRFAIDYWHSEGLDSIAPTEGVLRTHFDNTLNENEIDLSIEPEGTLEWSTAVLQGMYINRAWQPWVREFVGKVGGPDTDHLSRAEMLNDAIAELMEIQSKFDRRSEHVTVLSAIPKLIEDYNERAASGLDLSVQGIRLGFPMIDQHTGGIRGGEIGVFAGVPKAGKSFMAIHSADATFQDGGVPVLNVLENSIDMTLIRLACMRAGVDTKRFERGECTEDEIERVHRWYRTLEEQNGRQFHILQPEPGKRTFSHMIRKARTLGDALFVDQLTFVEIIPGTERKSRDMQIRDMMHDAANLLNTGRKMPMLLMHQINREGQKAAEKTGHLEMYHLAEAAEIERTATHVWGLWQSLGMRDAGNAWIQSLAARRYALQHFDITWIPHRGIIAARGPITLPDAA